MTSERIKEVLGIIATVGVVVSGIWSIALMIDQRYAKDYDLVQYEEQLEIMGKRIKLNEINYVMFLIDQISYADDDERKQILKGLKDSNRSTKDHVQEGLIQ